MEATMEAATTINKPITTAEREEIEVPPLRITAITANRRLLMVADVALVQLQLQ
jgi:hypothetical protein